MLAGIADTHAVIWYIFGDKRLSGTARTFMDTSAAAGNQIGLSSITLVEIAYLSEKGRISTETMNKLTAALDSPDSVLNEIIVDRYIAKSLLQIDRLKVPDMPDRIIAATAHHLGVPLISRDAKIQVSGIATIW